MLQVGSTRRSCSCVIDLVDFCTENMAVDKNEARLGFCAVTCQKNGFHFHTSAKAFNLIYVGICGSLKGNPTWQSKLTKALKHTPVLSSPECGIVKLNKYN